MPTAFSTKSLIFGGTDEYVTMGNVLGFERTDSFSFSFWFKTTTTAYGSFITKEVAGSACGYHVLINASGQIELWLVNQLVPPNYIEVRTNDAYNDGRWHHCVISYAGTSLASGVVIYVDGAAVTTTAVVDALSATIVNAGTLRLGSRDAADIWYIGALDEVSVYNKVLSLTEVGWIYNSRSPRDLTVNGAPSNLVAWWRCGDGDSFATTTIYDQGPSAVPNNVRDISGNNYTGTMTNMEVGDVVLSAPGEERRSVLFGGTDEYVTMGNVLDFADTSTFSLSFWVKTTAVSGGFIGKYVRDSTQRGYRVGFDDNPYFRMDYDSGNEQLLEVYAYDAPSINDGYWHHIVWTYSGGGTPASCQCYVDGKEYVVGEVWNSLAGSISNTGSFELGRDDYDLGYLVGNLDQVAVYDKVLSLAEVRWLYNGGISPKLSLAEAPSNLVGWWTMGDGDTYPTLLDNSGNAYNGTMTNMESGDIVEDTPGRGTWATKSLLFGGTDEYVTMGNVLGFERTSPFSVSFWFKTTSNGFLIAKEGSGVPTGYMIQLAGGAIAFELINVYPTNLLLVDTTTTWNDGVWHHACVAYNGSSSAAGVRIYIDNVLQAMNVYFDTLTASILTTASLRFGMRELDTTSPYVGNLDEVAVYNRVLSSAEVAWIYNTSVPRNLKAPDAPKWLVAYWRMGESAYPGTMTNMESTDITNDNVNANAAPLLEYTWRFKNNIDLNTTGTRIGDFRQLLLAFKNALITASGWTDSAGLSATLTKPWTVQSSSDGVTAGSGDKWLAPANLVWAASGSPHSWIVLKNLNIYGYVVQLCIDLNSAADYQISVILTTYYVFGSGTINNRPTAQGELQYYNAVTWTGLTAAFSGILNVAMSDDGKCTRMFFYSGGTVRCTWFIEKPKNLVGMYPPVFGMIGGAEPTYATLNDAAPMVLWKYNATTGTWGSCYLSTEFYVDGSIGQRQTTVSDVTAEWPLTRIGIICDTSGIRGRHGEMSDLWFGDVTLSNADTYPAVAPLKQFVQVGDLVFPWDRSTPVTT